jgi:hypothetical protein
MGKIVTAKVDELLISVFGEIGKSFADKIKKEYNLNELFVPNTLASQILAGKYTGKNEFKFKVRKTGINKGILELVN